ncbi:UTRA domain-containing protein [Sulfobacillus thermosulfidooxidans]|uniref:UTRA domain-containing protein n=1 Tax=Sulfobacillus thermosulfidooxidans TaxID=28034 RepID=UPI0006B49B86|nr:UTRA domain-containing protein [Sulfobacillus thermosulfidooxidans]
MSDGYQPRRWDEIFKTLQQEIDQGQWPPDTIFLTAEAIEKRFSVSIATANRVLQELEIGGWLYGAHGVRERRVVGTRSVSDRTTEFLRDPAWKHPWVQTLAAEVDNTPPNWVTQWMGTGPLWRWKALQGDGIIIVAISEGWYAVDSPVRAYAKAPGPNFYGLLEAHYGLLAGFQETVSARLADFDERKAFHAIGRAPLLVLQIDRVTRTRMGNVIEVVRLVDRASHYHLQYEVPYRHF